MHEPRNPKPHMQDRVEQRRLSGFSCVRVRICMVRSKACEVYLFSSFGKLASGRSEAARGRFKMCIKAMLVYSKFGNVVQG